MQSQPITCTGMDRVVLRSREFFNSCSPTCSTPPVAVTSRSLWQSSDLVWSPLAYLKGRGPGNRENNLPLYCCLIWQSLAPLLSSFWIFLPCFPDILECGREKEYRHTPLGPMMTSSDCSGRMLFHGGYFWVLWRLPRAHCSLQKHTEIFPHWIALRVH